ncbi:MAG: Na+/H+ antiporter subunit E [Actinomycetota bacterium]|nr:Na+/H+ antiporter subunit E [Actinomycetota bacterium]
MNAPARRPTGRPGLLLWLVAVWVGLWGDLSWANVLGGLAVAGVLLLALPLPDVPVHGRPGLPGVLHFSGVFLVELVKASWQVVRLVLRPRVQLRQAVVAVPVHGRGDRLLTLVANAISLTPGTLTLDVDRERSLLYVHALDVGTGPRAADGTRTGIAVLERAAARALGQADEVRRGQGLPR